MKASTSTLPSPEPEALVVSQRLRAVLAEEIRQSGPMRFDRYLEQIQYYPGLGYYAAGSTKFGAGGDFVTAPELGPVFARCLARMLAPALAELGAEACVLELGAGSGALAVDLLSMLDALNQLPAQYLILERSADLRARQAASLDRLPQRLKDRVQWLERPPTAGWTGLVFGNEVVDALPARRFTWHDDGWLEWYVEVVDGQFTRRLGSPQSGLGSELATAQDLAQPQNGYTSEIQPHLGPWLRSVTEHLETGLVVLVDYGYTGREYWHPARSSGTLIGHYRHHVVSDPFAWPGLIDWSVSVNFSDLACAMDDAGLCPTAFATQAAMLLTCGVDAETREAQEIDGPEQLTRLAEIKRLLLPSEMGERFLVLAGARGEVSRTIDFGPHDRLERL